MSDEDMAYKEDYSEDELPGNMVEKSLTNLTKFFEKLR